MVETVVTTIEDEFGPKIKKFIKRRELLVAIVCFLTFFLSFPNLCPVRSILKFFY
jgi:solute carrier family 6 GABA transporter-like protein 6/8/11/12/13